MADTAEATVEPQLYADTYVVVDGVGASARIYSVLDVYVKGNNNGDSMACAVLGLSSHSVIFKTSKATAGADIFVHGGSAGNGWLPTDSYAKSWDSFVTAGNRAQGSKARVTNRAGVIKDHGVPSSWSAGSGFLHEIQVADSSFINEGPSSGWYSNLGSNCSQSAGAAENPWARVSLYNSSWNTAYPDLYRGADVLLTKGQ
ncbi:MAG: hypothetical protein KGR47_12110, partial [Acidobacteria bacterium]|nr:hypothetical protein [Acidobacteriota bacterium]